MDRSVLGFKLAAETFVDSSTVQEREARRLYREQDLTKFKNL